MAKQAKKQRIMFLMNLSGEMNGYIEWLAKKRGSTKARVVREAVEMKMSGDVIPGLNRNPVK